MATHSAIIRYIIAFLCISLSYKCAGRPNGKPSEDKSFQSATKDFICGECAKHCDLSIEFFPASDDEKEPTIHIPKESRCIIFQEVYPTHNVLDVAIEDDYYFQNTGKIRSSHTFNFSGQLFHYENTKKDSGKSSEDLKALGPITDGIKIKVRHSMGQYVGNSTYFSRYCKYAKTDQLQYSLGLGDYEECPKAPGIYHRPIHCVQISDCRIVENELCSDFDKPEFENPCQEFEKQAKIAAAVKPNASTAACSCSDCDDIECPYEAVKIDYGAECHVCGCYDPCEAFDCPENQSCTVKTQLLADGTSKAEPLCEEGLDIKKPLSVENETAACECSYCDDIEGSDDIAEVSYGTGCYDLFQMPGVDCETTSG